MGYELRSSCASAGVNPLIRMFCLNIRRKRIAIMTLYQTISVQATSTWKPMPGSKNLGYYLSSGQIVFSTFTGYQGANRLQQKLNAINTTHSKKG